MTPNFIGEYVNEDIPNIRLKMYEKPGGEVTYWLAVNVACLEIPKDWIIPTFDLFKLARYDYIGNRGWQDGYVPEEDEDE